MPKSLVQSQFGDNAVKYATSVVHAKGESLTRLVELVEPQKSWRVLDIATAAGHTAMAFAPHVKEVVASDITLPMLQQASLLADERGIENLKTVEADAQDLPFDDGAFDLVTCRIAAHHFPDIKAFLAGSYRVLKPGGTFALVDNIAPDAHSAPNFSQAELIEAALSYNMFEKLRDPSHVKALTLDDWQRLLNEARFEVRISERLGKDMEFQPWASRLGADPATIDYVKAILTTAAAALRAFLKPRTQDGALWFTLQEAVIVATRAT